MTCKLEWGFNGETCSFSSFFVFIVLDCFKFAVKSEHFKDKKQM